MYRYQIQRFAKDTKNLTTFLPEHTLKDRGRIAVQYKNEKRVTNQSNLTLT